MIYSSLAELNVKFCQGFFIVNTKRLDEISATLIVPVSLKVLISLKPTKEKERKKKK